MAKTTPHTAAPKAPPPSGEGLPQLLDQLLVATIDASGTPSGATRANSTELASRSEIQRPKPASAHWTNLGPAKQIFTKRATKALQLIAEVDDFLASPNQAQSVAILQVCHRKLSQFAANLSQAETEAWQLLDSHPEVSSSPKAKNNNFGILCDHLNARNFKGLRSQMNILLQRIERKLEQRPIEHFRTSDCVQISHSGMKSNQCGKLPSLDSSNVSEKITKFSVENSNPQKSPSKMPDSPIMKNERSLSPEPSKARKSANSIEGIKQSENENHSIYQLLKELQHNIDKNNVITSAKVDGIVKTQHLVFQSIQTMQTNWENMQEELQYVKDRFKTLQDKVDEIDVTDDNNDQELCSIPESSNNQSKHLCLSNQRMSEVLKSPKPIVDSPTESPPIQARPSFGQYIYEPQMNVATILQTIKPFDDSRSNYALFITRFNALVHENPQINVILKQNILISLLEGEAKELITSSQLSEEAYDNLRSNLEITYNRDDDRRNQLLEEFRQLKFHQTDVDQMEKDTMKHLCTANSLELHGFSMNNDLAINIFIEKLPAHIMRTVIKFNRKHKLNPSFKDTIKLVQSLISENRVIQEAEQRRKGRTQLTEVCMAEINQLKTSNFKKENVPMKEGSKNIKHKSLNSHDKPIKPWMRSPCTFCKDNSHKSCDCQLTITQKREALIKEKNRCLNCLYKFHSTEDCRSPAVCFTCREKHHFSLCPEQEKAQKLMNLLSSTETDELQKFFRTNGVEL
uniref:Uncharacterized protein n=1 Tax=Caenorhabditis japonica TaxID=281687 RepID=A0A8R1DQ16_CAEJA